VPKFLTTDRRGQRNPSCRELPGIPPFIANIGLPFGRRAFDRGAITMSDAILRRTSRRRVQEPASPGRSSQQQPARPQSWAGKTPQEILARYQPGKAPPLKVLEVLIKLFNTQHTALEKTVSHKTRQERLSSLHPCVANGRS
jgi:hypothetical protein